MWESSGSLFFSEPPLEQNQDQYLKVKVSQAQFVDTLFMVRLRPNMSMHHAVIINHYFLVHKIKVENLTFIVN